MQETCDVFVLGGGPAGSTAAALLAERGWKVVIVDKERHPRFHIGESMLPMSTPLFERLGVREQVEKIGMVKHGAEFVSPQAKEAVTFDFSEAWNADYPSTYQVRRSQLDEILFRNSARKGAQTVEECRVSDVQFPKGEDVRVSAEMADGAKREWRARFFIDASGRDTFLSRRFDMKQRNHEHCTAAMFGHFDNATRLTGREEGNISIFWFDHGWFWFIPLLDGQTSVGAVCNAEYMKSRKGDTRQFFFDTIARCPALGERLAQAKLPGNVTATGNYSYFSERMYGERWILVGDAWAFVDPVFSSGVLLGMNSAFRGVEAVDTFLRDPAKAPAALRQFERTVRSGVRNFSWFIYRMTSPGIETLFMHPSNKLKMQTAVISLLAGDLFRGTPIQPGLRAFKVVYYLWGLLNPRLALEGWRRRRRSVRAGGLAEA
ncbi:hydroxylase [Betaproteobacteria bacterium SCGC AG-212-J23]|nr:hydroxylase [Betaproteobacteria bacterium SCGC AG-212-J23]